MMKSKLTLAALLTIVGFLFSDHTEGASTDSKCTLEVETVDVDVPLSPSVCGQSSVTVTSVKRGFCKNNGNECGNMHLRHTSTLYEQSCLAKTATTVTGTVGVSGCSETVTYRFINVTDCQCQYMQASTRT